MANSIIERIHEFDRFGSVLGLQRLEELLHRLGDPQTGLRYIHVAGTNGKGSVCKYLESGLSECGYRVGLYISPFIEVFNERIQCEGKYITDEELEEYGWQAVRATEEMVADGLVSPTEFEVVMAAAFLFFQAKKPDIVILECGMGGEGDATNVIRDPLACVFTTVSFDHMQVLGNTLEEIARTKAGIIKDHAPVISGVADPAAAAVIAETARSQGSDFYDVSKIPVRIEEEDPVSQKVSLELWGTDYSGVRTSMVGPHQAENLRTALAVLELLRRNHKIDLQQKPLYDGLLRASQPGRFEVVRGRDQWIDEKRYAPLVILDGAHNEAGAGALEETMKRYFRGRRILLVTGILADKEVDRILDHFTAVTRDIIVTEPDNPRKLAARDLADQLSRRGIDPVGIAGSPRESVYQAESVQENYDIILFAGSLYLIGAVRRALRYDGNKSEKKDSAVL